MSSNPGSGVLGSPDNGGTRETGPPDESAPIHRSTAPGDRRTRWAELTRGVGGREYAARFAAQAAAGRDMHGEAAFCAGLLEPPARVLDAGCGTGRVAIRLAELGFLCTGVDVDESMLGIAREAAPCIPWFRADLASLTASEIGDAEPFHLVVLAGNVIPLLTPGTTALAVRGLCEVLVPDGLLVAGFGLDPAHLPPRCPATPLAEYDDACSGSGLVRVHRFATWGRDPFVEPAGYAVTVHRKPRR